MYSSPGCIQLHSLYVFSPHTHSRQPPCRYHPLRESLFVLLKHRSQIAFEISHNPPDSPELAGILSPSKNLI